MMKFQAVLIGELSARSISYPASRRYYRNIQRFELASTWQIIPDPFQDPFRVQNRAIQVSHAIGKPIKPLIFEQAVHVDIVEVVGSSPISSIGFLMVSIAGPNGALNQAGWTDQMILSFTDSDDSLTPLLTAHNLYGLAVTNEIGIQDVHCGNSDVDE